MVKTSGDERRTRIHHFCGLVHRRIRSHVVVGTFGRILRFAVEVCPLVQRCQRLCGIVVLKPFVCRLKQFCFPVVPEFLSAACRRLASTGAGMVIGTRRLFRRRSWYGKRAASGNSRKLVFWGLAFAIGNRGFYWWCCDGTSCRKCRGSRRRSGCGWLARYGRCLCGGALRARNARARRIIRVAW